MKPVCQKSYHTGLFSVERQVSEYFLILLCCDQAKMLGLERLDFWQYRGSIENGTNELEDHGDSVHRGSEDLESNEIKR